MNMHAILKKILGVVGVCLDHMTQTHAHMDTDKLKLDLLVLLLSHITFRAIHVS